VLNNYINIQKIFYKTNYFRILLYYNIEIYHFILIYLGVIFIVFNTKIKDGDIRSWRIPRIFLASPVLFGYKSSRMKYPIPPPPKGEF
jgi:hypothetical protein